MLNRLIPKKTLLHEFANLPEYWSRMKVDHDTMVETRYSFGKHWRQYLLLLEPKTPKANRKQVIFYHHGGGWHMGRPERFRAHAQFFTDQGYSVFMGSYRRPPMYRYKAIREDLSLGLLKILEVMKEKGITDKKIIVGGMSAGANVSSSIIFNTEELDKIGLDDRIFGGLILCSGPLNLDQMPNSIVLKNYAGKRKSKSFYEANPHNFIKQIEGLKVFCVHGTHDAMVPLEAAQSFIEKIKKNTSIPVQFQIVQEGTHLDGGKWHLKDNPLRHSLRNWLATF